MKNTATRLLASLVLLVSIVACDRSGSLQGGIEGSGNRVTSGGAVSSLGSIFVNDVEYDLTGAAITVDGVLARESDLAVGSIVIVEGGVSASGTTGKATRVTAGTAVAGPIGSVDIAANAFTLLGQTVVVDLATKIEQAVTGQPLGGLAVGSDVAVSGFLDSTGAITALRIAPRAAGKPLQVTGSVAQLDTANRRFAINGATVDYTSARLIGFGTRDLDGAAVRVTAAAVNASGVLVADEVVFREAGLPGALGDSAALQGWVTRYASPTDFDVDGYRVVVTPATRVVGNLALDSFVQVRGDIVADGALRISQLVDTVPFAFAINDAVGNPLAGAAVSFAAGGTQYRAVTGANGSAMFDAAPIGEWQVSVSALGYETLTFTTSIGRGSRSIGLRLQPAEAWASGRAIVLGTRMLDRASDGSAMTFSVDVAVVNGRAEAMQTLTSADFAIDNFDCGWGGPRDCASDANGAATGGTYSAPQPQAFGLQPPEVRRPHPVRVLAVRNRSAAFWDPVVPALKSFFAQVGGGDIISLSSVQLENSVSTHTVLGPFTGDGSSYFDEIDALAIANGDEPVIVRALEESIQGVAAAGPDGTVLVLAAPWVISVADVQAVTARARQLGVHISTVDLYDSYGVPEMTPRTGGFVAQVSDPRQFAMVLGAADEAMSRALPYYRLEFRLTSMPGTFVVGGNAKARLRIDVPTPLPTPGVWATLDVAIE